MTDAGKIIKSGAGEKIADLVNKLAGPFAEEAGMMLGHGQSLSSEKLDQDRAENGAFAAGLWIACERCPAQIVPADHGGIVNRR